MSDDVTARYISYVYVCVRARACIIKRVMCVRVSRIVAHGGKKRGEKMCDFTEEKKEEENKTKTQVSHAYDGRRQR